MGAYQDLAVLSGLVSVAFFMSDTRQWEMGMDKGFLEPSSVSEVGADDCLYQGLGLGL